MSCSDICMSMLFRLSSSAQWKEHDDDKVIQKEDAGECHQAEVKARSDVS